jgi:hypothetical protein
MVLALRDKDYLRASRSPLVRVLAHHPEIDGAGDTIDWFNRTYRTAIHDSTVRRDRKSPFWSDLVDGLRKHTNSPASILRGLSDEDILKLTLEGTVLQATRGDAIIRKNGYGNSMFLVLSGGARMHRNGSDAIVEEYRSGNVFGEISLVTDGRRSRNITITEDSEIFVFTYDHLQRLMKTAPDLAARVLLNISQIMGSRLTSAAHNAHTPGLPNPVAA